MKKIYLFLFVTLFFLSSKAQFQVHTPAYSTEKEVYNIGIHPFTQIILEENTQGESYYGSNFVVEYGLTKTIDAYAKFGVMYYTFDNVPTDYNDHTKYYFGAEIEKNIVSTGNEHKAGIDLSLSGGIHSQAGYMGGDASFKFSFRNATRRFFLFTGFDLDVNEEIIITVGEPDKRGYGIYYWIPAGFYILPTKKVAISLEADIPMSGNNNLIAGLGLRYYFSFTKKHFN